METNLKHLPANKQEELEKIVELIRTTEKGVEMIILFGSYARGDFVDRDVTTEDRMTYEYRSDFDILVVVSDEELAQDYGVWSKVKETIRQDKSIQTPVRLIVEDIGFLNHKLAIGHYFYSDIKKQGIMLGECITQQRMPSEYSKRADGDAMLIPTNTLWELSVKAKKETHGQNHK